jgi:predicted N-acetyltransferase YhbS
MPMRARHLYFMFLTHDANTMTTSIRTEQPADIDDIYALNKVVFGQDNEAKLLDHIRQTPGFIPELSLVAVDGDKIIGYILLSKMDIANGDKHFESLGVTSMVVHPDYQRQGVGAKLITHSLQKATLLGYTSVLAFGHEYYFPKFGFLPAVRWNIRPPFDVPSEVFMAIELEPNALTNVSGIVEFPIEFSVI